MSTEPRIETTVVGNVTVKVTTTRDWGREIEQQLKAGLNQLGTEILNEAVQNAPILTGALRESGTLTIDGTTAKIHFGNEDVPYARMRHYVNNLHPDTKYYLQRAGDSVSRNAADYFKGGSL